MIFTLKVNTKANSFRISDIAEIYKILKPKDFCNGAKYYKQIKYITGCRYIYLNIYTLV